MSKRRVCVKLTRGVSCPTQALGRSVSLLRGPPGTGKTRTAAVLIAAALRVVPASELVTASPSRILAVAHSNGAADVLLETLLSLGVPAVRAEAASPI